MENEKKESDYVIKFARYCGMDLPFRVHENSNWIANYFNGNIYTYSNRPMLDNKWHHGKDQGSLGHVRNLNCGLVIKDIPWRRSLRKLK